MIEFGNALPHDIHITGSANKGFIVKAGCSVCTFSDKKEMLEAIEHYIDDPDKMEKLYNDSTKHLRPQAADCGGRSMVGAAERNQVMATEDCCQDECYPDTGR